MTNSNVDDALREAVFDVVCDRLGAQHVVDVLVCRDDDEDEENVLLVTIIIDNADASFDEDRVLGLVRHLRPRLALDGELAFPVISFSTDQERRAVA